MKIKKLKLNSKGFGHVELLVFLVGILSIGTIGSYVYLHRSHAATVTQSYCQNTLHGVWLDLSSKGVTSHGPCWSTPGAYLVNFGAGVKSGSDDIDQVPASGNNPETGSASSLQYDYPNYVIIVGNTSWKICKERSGTDSCTSKFTKSLSGNRYGGGPVAGPYYNLCSVDYYRYLGDLSFYSKLCSDQGVYIKRV